MNSRGWSDRFSKRARFYEGLHGTVSYNFRANSLKYSDVIKKLEAKKGIHKSQAGFVQLKILKSEKKFYKNCYHI